MEETIVVFLINEQIKQDSIYIESSRLAIFCCRGNEIDLKVTGTFWKG